MDAPLVNDKYCAPQSLLTFGKNKNKLFPNLLILRLFKSGHQNSQHHYNLGEKWKIYHKALKKKKKKKKGLFAPSTLKLEGLVVRSGHRRNTVSFTYALLSI